MNSPCTPAQQARNAAPAPQWSEPAARKLPRHLAAASLLFMLLIMGLLSGCKPLESTPPTPTLTPLPPTITPTGTPTIVWFPSTATHTPYPTRTALPPTEEMRPNLGAILLEDRFEADSPWSTSRTAQGSALIGANELTISIPSDKLYLTSLRQEPMLADFYVEITAGPTFCQGQDEYGLLLRYTSPGDFYRIAVSCDGQVRLDRLYRDQASSPQPWVLSGALPIGAPSRSRLAVWAQGRELRVFINDEFQFQVSDPQLTQGQIGVFARSTGGHLLTVGFSDLVVTEINP